MTVFVFRVWLLPNPPQGFNPDKDVLAVIKIDGRQTLEDFHDVIFDAFYHWGTHQYEFVTYDSNQNIIRYNSSLRRKSGDESKTESDSMGRRASQAIINGVRRWVSTSRSNSPETYESVDVMISEVGSERLQSLLIHSDPGISWEYHIEFEEMRQGSLDADPIVIDTQGIPPRRTVPESS